ncbi:MAG: PGF-CTERM sorting domain-containing protein [Methanothrix soehngenii]|jgi:hypothetical protein|uniref:PGF-CTERM archaeal protein-sorting signal domain-containing protein n=1 Tax=Methanothrix soehngenii TaxID=2223 RepID=A0A7K4AH21_METSH|nr:MULTISPECIES: PGF-CTERM sorting domain-containing protein [Methanothrix]MDD3552356.1 PGF-CTERM sorting domain-containing protein [Methanothrix soehngenii]NLJ22276.1 hypothetical protein [Methanothrix soehngenii]UEC39294.1 MAG: Translation initiation factor 2B gamma subunit [Methanothrix sp.]HPE52256.1 PGF-CTERM sorting domain-containing protein [Methanothrix soehngenii]HRW33123.1 PGF-CTERM sorting domain-containing protein [Methanothrix sp.]
MRKSILALLLALFAIMALAAPIYAEDDDDDEDDEEENEASSESESDSDEKSTPGFGFAFAVAGTLAGARLIRSKIH